MISSKSTINCIPLSSFRLFDSFHLIMNIIFSLVTALIVSLGVLVVIISNIEPTLTLSASNVEFYAFFFIFTYSLISLVNYIFINKNKASWRILNRRVLLGSFFISGVLIMSSLQVLNIVSLVSFLIATALIELFFISYKRNEK